MRKSTLKKGGIVLLGALAVTGVSMALNTRSIADPAIRAPWYVDYGNDMAGVGLRQPSISLSDIFVVNGGATRVNIHTHAKTTGEPFGNYWSAIDFGQMKNADLMDGVYVTFLNVDGHDDADQGKYYDGQHLTMPYDEIMNHEKMYTATSVTMTKPDGSKALGIYQNMTARTAVDFVYSTKGLSGVEAIDFDMYALGDKDYVGRSITWNVKCWVYDLAGNLIPGTGADDAVVDKPNFFTAKNHTIGSAHTSRSIIQTSDVNGGKEQGGLDNKIVVVHFYSDVSMADPDVEAVEGISKDTEPVTIIDNARIRFNRPAVVLTTDKVEFKAGAGRNTSCDPATLVTTVDFWNSLYRNSGTNNQYTNTFTTSSNNRQNLALIDGAKNTQYDYKVYEQLAYYELAVKYPFIADQILLSKNEDLTKVDDENKDGWYSLDELANDNEIVRIGTPGVDSMVIYRIPREYFVQKDASESSSDNVRTSTGKFKFYFAPQEVKTFPKAKYIYATTSAEASDTTFIELSGSSLPVYNELGELHFDEYKDWKSTPISFENLPYFNSILNKDGNPITYTEGGVKKNLMPEHRYGTITLSNRTKAPMLSTDRYDDDVDIRGWKIVFKYDSKRHNVARSYENNGLEEYIKYLKQTSTGSLEDQKRIAFWEARLNKVELKDGDEIETYIPMRFLPMRSNGATYFDYVKWYEENNCDDCWVSDEVKEIGDWVTDLSIIDCSGNIDTAIVSVNAIFRYSRGDVNVGDDDSKYVNETYTISPRLSYTADIARFNYPTSTANVLRTIQKKYSDLTNLEKDALGTEYFTEAQWADKVGVSVPVWNKANESTKKGWIDNALFTIGNDYGYSAQDLMNKKDGAKYEGPIKIYGNNTFVWFNETDQSLLSHALGLVSPELLNAFSNIANKDFFFAPYDEWDRETYESRPHIVKVFATGLKPDVPGGTIASIKVFKEKFSTRESMNDQYYHTNAFMFSGTNKDFAKVYVKRGSVEKPIEEFEGGAKGGMFIGTSMGDTLVYKVDLDNDYAVQYLEEVGLDLIVKYVPSNDVESIKWLKDNWEYLEWSLNCLECASEMPNLFNHVAQFGAITPNQKGFNEFYTFGSTERGLVTSMNADKIIGSYTSFYSFITKQFGTCPTCVPSDGNMQESAQNLIYNEMFRKDYKTRYVNTCYPVRDGQFVVAGLNITDPVDMEVFSNKVGAFNYVVTPLTDLNGEPYGKVDTVDNVVHIYPNKYGEILALVYAQFDPKDRDGIEMTIDTITSGTEKGMWARYYAMDSIRLAPQQYAAEVEPRNRVYFFDLDDYKTHSYNPCWECDGIWALYGPKIADTLTAKIKGDIKVPEVWFSSDPAGKDTINDFHFGVVNAGSLKDSAFYIQGRDLPHYGTTVNDTDPKVEQEINLLSGTDLFTFGTDKAKDLKLYIRNESMALAATAADKPYTYKGGENDLVNGVLRGDVATKVNLYATPNVEDLCDNASAISLVAVCDVQKDLSLAFTPGLEKPYIQEMQPGDVGGSDARIKWTATPGAEYYQVAVGRFTPKYTSEDVFISEVRADFDSKNIWVELFNATGDVIHRDNKVNYWLEVTKEYTDEDGKPAKTVEVVSVDNFELQGNTQPVDRNWGYAPVAHQMPNMQLTEDHTKPVRYTIRLMEGFQTDAHQIDIYLFDTPSTWMVRKPVNPMPINNGAFNTGEWRTEVGSLPIAYYEWQDDISFDGEESFKVDPKATSIAVHNLLPQTAYTARVRAFNKCVGGEEMIPSEDFYDFATSKTPTSAGDIYFDDADEIGVGNESINTTAVRVLGGEGQVTIRNAAGKKVSISNVLGQSIANTVITSDEVTFSAPQGIVVVTIEGETTVKTVVK